MGGCGFARSLVECHQQRDGLKAMDPDSHYPKHYCGVFGVYGHPNAAELTYYGLYALQHRGQESAGIVSCDGTHFFQHKGMGLVPQIFKGKELHELVGEMAIGHTRYSTTGSSNIGNAQPLTVDCSRGQIAIAHNGNLTNAAALRLELEERGSIFQTTVDSEIVLHWLAQPTQNGENTLVSTIRKLEGAFSMLIMTEKEMIGVRDPHGFRPLCIGKLANDTYVLSSETCALDLIEAEFVRDVEPGEIVIIDDDGLRSIQAFPEQEKRSFCIFEYVYFARPDSYVFGQSVNQVRTDLGRRLAREVGVDADVVVPIPDSGVCAALGFAEESGIPLKMGLIRNHYVGRTFIYPQQAIRDFKVKVKLNPVKSILADKRVVLVDDSIVRGTTARKIVGMVRAAGAREVHMRISCPPTISPCYYGIDTPRRSELIGATHTVAEIQDFLEADSLAYLDLEGLLSAVGSRRGDYCTSCYTGKYPVEVPRDEDAYLQLALKLPNKS